MKTIFPPGHHHNGFVATHALGHMINRTSCVQVHELLQSQGGNTGREHCFRDYISLRICKYIDIRKRKCKDYAFSYFRDSKEKEMIILLDVSALLSNSRMSLWKHSINKGWTQNRITGTLTNGNMEQVRTEVMVWDLSGLLRG